VRQGIEELGHGRQRHPRILGNLRRRAHFIRLSRHLAHNDDGIVGQPVELEHRSLQIGPNRSGL